MKQKKIKNKRKQKYLIKILFLLFFFSFSFCFALKSFQNSVDNELFLKLLLTSGNGHMQMKQKPKILKPFFSFLTQMDFQTPTSILPNHYIGKNFITSADDIKDLDTLPASNYVKDPYQKEDIENPMIYLYNTHQSEEYSTDHLESYNVKPTVMMTSYILREKLNKNNLPTIVEENNVTEFLITNNWNYASSYKVTKFLLEDAYNKNSTLKYFIDLHRDSVKKSISTTTINNKKYAKILFVLGLENKNYEENLKLMTDLNNLFQEKYPTLSRGIHKKQGAGVNGVYNQDFHKNTILIEVGGEENTIDEVYNTCEAISVVLTEYIKNGENYEG